MVLSTGYVLRCVKEILELEIDVLISQSEVEHSIGSHSAIFYKGGIGVLIDLRPVVGNLLLVDGVFVVAFHYIDFRTSLQLAFAQRIGEYHLSGIEIIARRSL